MIKYVCTIAVLTTAIAFAQSEPATARINKGVHHELTTLPNYGVFDHLEFHANGGVVTLLGQASRPALKQDAERAVKRIEGVTTVNNKIEVLSLSSNDDRIRATVYRRLYGTPALQKYTSNRSGPILSHLSRRLGITNDPPIGYHAIHIIVNHGNVILEGAVGAQGDSDIANIQANTVSGVFSVTNNLRVDG